MCFVQYTHHMYKSARAIFRLEGGSKRQRHQIHDSGTETETAQLNNTLHLLRKRTSCLALWKNLP